MSLPIIDALDLANKEMPSQARIVTHEGKKWIELDPKGKFYEGSTYDIELDDIFSEASLARWVYHLTGKNWVTNQMLREFMDLVAHEKKYKLYLWANK